MRSILLFLLLLPFFCCPLEAQQRQPILLDTVVNLDPSHITLLLNAMEYHKALVMRDAAAIKNRTSKQLRYGHSNGWIETRNEQIKNIESGYLIYHSFKEDSMTIRSISARSEFTINGQMPFDFYPDNRVYLILNATIDVSKEGVRNTYQLKVAELWEKKSKRENGWQLLRRTTHRMNLPPGKH